jgi:hypothetical protein
MVATDACPICQKPILRDESSVVRARIRGLPETIVAVFHDACYPGDEGTVFVRVDEDDPGID